MDPSVYDAAASTLIVGILEAVKKAVPETWTRFFSLFAIVLGVVYGIAARPNCTTSVQCVISGMLIGLAASGIHSGAKHLAEKPHVPNPPSV